MSQVQSQSFLYTAMLPSGSRTMGFRVAPDEAALSEELKRKDLLLLKAWKLPLGASAPTDRFPLKDEAAMNEQLHILLSRGVPLVESLEVAASVVSAKSKEKVDRMREAVAAGTAFSLACEKVGGFDTVSIAVYRAAERTGDLSGAAQRLAQAARRRLAISGKAVTIMIYPSIVVTVALLMFSGLLLFIVPMIAAQIREMGTTLPTYSAIVFAIGEWGHDNLRTLLLIIGALLVGAVLFYRNVIAIGRSLVAKAPGFSDLLLSAELTRFFSVLAAMVRTGVPLAEALGNSTGVISDSGLRSQLEKLRQSLVEGGVLRVLIDRVDKLPLATRKLLIAAERAGDLDSAFDTLSQEMANDVDKKSSRLLAMLEPAVIVGMFVLLGPLIVAIAVPMLTFSNIH